MLITAEKNATEYAPLLDRDAVERAYRHHRFIYRLRDILLSAAALLFLWPFLAIVALVIVIDDPHGSPIFSQTRVGRNGKEFRFYKFRSMRNHAEEMLDELLKDNEMDGPAFKMKEDPRITRVGKFLRKSSIDELPQLWNVLKGDMSIVGPRPALPREVAQYNAYMLQRLLIHPGLTCYWQVQPMRNSLTFDQWVDLDIKYIQERSFFTDLKIILRTFGAVFGMNGQ